MRIQLAKKHNKTKLIEKFLANLFFLFFVAQIFSPYISGRTIYLELFIAIFNPYFLHWIKNKKITKQILWFIIGGGILIILLQLILVVKLIAIFISVLFLFYAYDRNMFYLDRYLILSILIAILQFSFLFIDPAITHLLGPTNITKIIWGAYATPSFTNFYTVFWIPRVSGLSREAGFFASFLMVSILFFYLERRRNGLKPKRKIINLFLWIGYILSFSKMSILLVPIMFIEKSRKYINLIPFVLTVVFFVLFFMFFWDYNRNFMLNSDTFLHRFAGYPSLFDINLKQLFLGIKNVSEIDSIFAQALSYKFDNFAGFSGFLLDKGLFVLFVFLAILWITGLPSSGILLLLLFTLNVQLDTNQNFVVMAYFILYKYYVDKQNMSKD